MPGIARGSIDFATTHISLSGSDIHLSPGQTTYVGGAGATVFVNGFPAIVQGDKTTCGELALIGSTTVFIGGKCVHRLNDLCDSHVFTYSPSICESASGDVLAGG